MLGPKGIRTRKHRDRLCATRRGAYGFAPGPGARGGRLVEVKKRRMRFIATNGLLIRLPSAFALAAMTNAGRFDALFHGVPVLGLPSGAVNFVLIALKMRDGLRLSSRLRPRVAPRT